MKECLFNILKNLPAVFSILKNRTEKIFKLGQAVAEPVDERQEFLGQVDKAHREWQIALNNFNYASDPDLIDYYIYNIEAAEKRYVYFIKQARKENVYSEHAEIPEV